MTIKNGGRTAGAFLTGMQELGIEEQDIVTIVADAVAGGQLSQHSHEQGKGGAGHE